MTLGRFGLPACRPRSDDTRQRAAPDLGAARCVKSFAILNGDPTYADAVLERLVHNAHRIDLNGESLRRSRKPGDLISPRIPR
jgi:hypothetical protein